MDRSKDTARATRDGLWERLQEQYKGWSEEVIKQSAVCEVCRVKQTGFIALVRGKRVICYDCACTQKVYVDDKVACIVPGCALPGDHVHENVDPAGETFEAIVKEVSKVEPNHYQLSNGTQVIDLVRDMLDHNPTSGFVAYCLGNVVKYTFRFARKEGVTDLKKAQRYLGWAIEQLEKEAPKPSTHVPTYETLPKLRSR